jgi:hypothetical protein
MLELGIVSSAAFKFAFVEGKLSTTSLACWRELFEFGDRTENTRLDNHLLFTASAFFDFNTFKARVINGSMPFAISVFLLSSLMSTGTPLPS